MYYLLFQAKPGLLQTQELHPQQQQQQQDPLHTHFPNLPIHLHLTNLPLQPFLNPLSKYQRSYSDDAC